MHDAHTVSDVPSKRPPSERQRQWGRNIRVGRSALGFSQQQLAKAVGVSQSNVARWERGLTAPADDRKLKIAAVLRQDVRMLFPLYVANVA
jgi:transcriptional regulator with XRE-family HTH domain